MHGTACARAQTVLDAACSPTTAVGLAGSEMASGQGPVLSQSRPLALAPLVIAPR